MSEDKNLENELESQINGPKEKAKPQGFKNQDEEIGFHKGALNTLMGERNELVKIVGNVEAIMQSHLKRLKELGIEIK